MDYIFGVVDRNGVTVENLKTVGEAHSDLDGFVQTVREYSDSIITDRFRVVEKYRSDEDTEGNCYDWYVIAEHYRYEDKFTPVSGSLKQMNEATSIAFVTLAESGSIDDVTAGEHAEMFAMWETDIAYAVGNIRRYRDGKLYRCLQAHTSQPDWTPDVAVSLWVCISDPAEEWPAWSQPVGAHDAYANGAKVSHKNKHWISTCDANVWEPGVYGWEESA